MAYGSDAGVKERLDITGTAEDTRVARARTQVSELIDNELKDFTTVPVSPVPQIITDIANDWAAGIVRDEITNPTSQNPPPNVFVQRAKENLERYIAQTYEADTEPVFYEQPID